MAKQITKTTVRYTESHDRMALTVKFVSGEEMRIGSNRGSATFRTARPSTFAGEKPTQAHMSAILKASDTFVDGENNGQRFERLGKLFETTNSVVEAAKLVGFSVRSAMIADIK